MIKYGWLKYLLPVAIMLAILIAAITWALTRTLGLSEDDIIKIEKKLTEHESRFRQLIGGSRI